MAACVFCEIVAGRVPCTKVYEDGDFLSFRDIHPAAPVHLVLIPKKHIISNIGEAESSHTEMLGRMLVTARKIASKENIVENFQVRSNTGDLAGQSVMHIHFHILGGWNKGENS